MCFHNSLSESAQEIEIRFNAKFESGVDFQPTYHAAFKKAKGQLSEIAHLQKYEQHKS